MDRCIRFGFLTGVTKIGKLSVFSGLNNLRDISMLPQYADICGISEADLHKYFGESVRELAAANGMNEEQCYAKLAEMYDIMQRTSYDITHLTDEEVDSSLLSTVNTAFENPIPLLYQSGYLSIIGYDPEFALYRLGFPNMEVKTGFLNFIFQYYVPGETTSGITMISKMARALRGGKPEEMMKLLEGLFARANYQIQGDAEKDFQYAMYIIFELLGEYVQTEKQTSNGRIDILLQTKDYVYIMELKVDGNANEALRQIEEKGYDRPFADDQRKLFKIGVSFSKENRRIEGWKIR